MGRHTNSYALRAGSHAACTHRHGVYVKTSRVILKNFDICGSSVLKCCAAASRLRRCYQSLISEKTTPWMTDCSYYRLPLSIHRRKTLNPLTLKWLLTALRGPRITPNGDGANITCSPPETRRRLDVLIEETIEDHTSSIGHGLNVQPARAPYAGRST